RYMKKKKPKNALSERHIAQIIRRKMTQKIKPSKKVYSRKDKREQAE
ncbi:MAG: hypothetical protein RLZZ630_1210, partial [Bacteroidota bacterium]